MDPRRFCEHEHGLLPGVQPQSNYFPPSRNWWTFVEERSSNDTGYCSGLPPPEVPVNVTLEETINEPTYTNHATSSCHSAWSPYSTGTICTFSKTMPTTTFLHNRLDQHTPTMRPPADYVVPMSRYRPPLLVDRPIRSDMEKVMEYALSKNLQDVYSAGLAPLQSRIGVKSVPIHTLFAKEEPTASVASGRKNVDLHSLTARDLFGKDDQDSSFWEHESTSNLPLRTACCPGVSNGSNNTKEEVKYERGSYFPKPRTAREQGDVARDTQSAEAAEINGNGEMSSFLNNLERGGTSRTSTPLPNEPHLHFNLDEQRNERMLEVLRKLCASPSNAPAPTYVKMTVKSMQIYDVDPATAPGTFTAPLDEIVSVADAKITATVTNRQRRSRRAPSSSPDADGAAVCKFCFKNGEPEEVYATHLTKTVDGLVSCPVLQKYVCELCGATGTASHTRSYCPRNPDGPAARRPPGYRRLSNGVLTSYFNHK